MGIDAQRCGASELPDRAVEVRRAQGATTKAIPVWIVEEEQRSDRPHSGPCNLRQTNDGRAQQDPCALRVAAARGHLRCWRPSTMHTDIACGPPPSDAQRTLFTSGSRGHAVGIRPRGARNAALCTFATDSWAGYVLRCLPQSCRANAASVAGAGAIPVNSGRIGVL